MEVLILEDKKMVADILSLIMVRYHHNVNVYSRAKEALNDYKPKKYDIIIVDLILPDMNGMNFIKEIRKLDKNIPVIVCSGYITEQCFNLQEKYNIGAFFNKPLDVKQLNDTINKLTKGK